MSFLARSFGVIGLVGLFGVACVLPTLASSSSTVAITPLILHTADGRFLEIHSGISGASEAEILARLNGTWTAVETPTVPPTPPVSQPPTSPSNDPPAPSFLTNVQTPRVIVAVRRARVLLSAGIEAPQTLTKQPPDWRTVVLAIWNQDTDEVRLVSVEKNGRALRNGPSDLYITVRGGSNYNTDYGVMPANNIVVGERYPIVQSSVVKKKTVYTITPTVYVPANQSLHTNEVIGWGKVVLDQLVNATLAQMRTDKIPSKAFPGKLLADAADPVVLKSIMAIEHMDHGSVRTGADDRLDLFYLELALNEQNAFHAAVSSAGANGLLQFIPSTYAAVVKHWPSLHLISDFHQGTGDLPNAMKAGIAYLDEVWGDLPAKARDQHVTSPESMRAYLIAAYNTGGVRVRRAINNFGEAWDQDYRSNWEKLDAKQTSLAISVHSLKKKVAAEKGASAKKKLQTQLTTTTTQYNQVTDQLSTLEASRLKAETLSYLQKYRLIAPRMKAPVQVALMTH